MNRKYRKRKTPRFFFIIALTLFLFIGIGYSVINSNLSMQGNVVRKATTWNIGFDNPVFDTGSITNPTPTITDGTTMTMNVTLTNPGDIYAFTVDLKNTGSVPALINTLTITELTAEQQNYLRWKVEYEDGSTPTVGDVLKAGKTKKVHIYLEYKKLRAVDLYPTSAVNLNLSIAANFNLPEETFNTVTLIKNGSTKLVKVSNLEQEITLEDFPVESTDQVIACNNGVEPSTDANDKIVLSKVKQNATCRIETSLANAVTNSSTEVTNIAILQDATTDTRVTIPSTHNITLNLNKKTYTFTTGDDNSQIVVEGIFNIKDNNKTGELKTTQRALIEFGDSAVSLIKNSKLSRYNSSGMGSVIRSGGTITIINSTITSNNSISISSYVDNTIVYIDGSVIQGNAAAAVAISRINTTYNIKNSDIISSGAYSIGPNVDTINNSKVYLCNNTISSNAYDISNLKTNVTYYYYNNTFRNLTGNPTLSNPEYTNVRESSIACAE